MFERYPDEPPLENEKEEESYLLLASITAHFVVIPTVRNPWGV